MLKYNLLVLCLCILRVQGIDLVFSGCNRNGWSCQTTTTGIGIDVIFTCSKELEEQNSNVTWRYNGLPSSTKSVTIENCNIAIILDDVNQISNAASKTVKSASVTTSITDYLIYLRSIVIRNVKELNLQSNFKDLLSRLRGNASVLFEDVGIIKVLPSHLIEGPSPEIQTNKMESFNFTMKRTQIEDAEDRAVLWDKENIPLHMTWENVIVQTEARLADVISSTRFRPYAEPEDNQIYIRNCTFKTIVINTFILNTTVFHFTDNYVETFNSHGIDIDSLYTNISGNTFKTIKTSAFRWIMIGKLKKNFQFNNNIIHASDGTSLFFEDFHPNLDLESRVSIHGNKFNCKKATWLHKSNSEAENMCSVDMYEYEYKLMKRIENIFFMNSDNICMEYDSPLTVNDYKEYYINHRRAPQNCKNP